MTDISKYLGSLVALTILLTIVSPSWCEVVQAQKDSERANEKEADEDQATDEDAEEKKPPKNIAARKIEASIEKPIEYSTNGYVPKHLAGKKLPLVIVQHGYGDTGEYYHDELKPLADKMGFAFINPNGNYDIDGGGHAWDSSTPKVLAALIEEIGTQEDDIDVKKCVYFGFSAGATSAIQCAAHKDCNAIGALVNCGGLKPWISKLPKTARLWVAYGKQDFNYKTLKKRLDKYVREFKGSCSLNLFEDTGHEIPSQKYLRFGFYYILNSKRKDEKHEWPRTPPVASKRSYKHILISHAEATDSRDERTAKEAEKLAKQCLKSLKAKKPKTWSSQSKQNDDQNSDKTEGKLTKEHFEKYRLGFEYDCLVIVKGSYSIVSSEYGVHVVWYEK